VKIVAADGFRMPAEQRLKVEEVASSPLTRLASTRQSIRARLLDRPTS
jgi:hypothetical protein